MTKKKKILTSLLLATSILFISATSLAYNDINGHWAEKYINSMSSAGVLGQFEDVNIYPDRPMNRAECAELISDFAEIYNSYKPTYTETSKFHDLIPETRNTLKIEALSNLFYYSGFTSLTDYLNSTISQNRIINGYPDGTFQPYNNVTRAEFAKMLVSALDCFGYLSTGNSGWYYSDMQNHWGFKYIDIAYGINVMNGYSQYIDDEGFVHIEFKPDLHITRAEAIKMVMTATNQDNYGRLGTRYKWDTHLYRIDGN